MLKRIFLLSLLISNTLAAETNQIFVKKIQEVKLFGATEYHIVNVVSTMAVTDTENLIHMLQRICQKLPTNEKYVLVIFDSEKAADAQIANPMAGLNIAEINARNVLTLFPYDTVKRKTVTLKPDWCEHAR